MLALVSGVSPVPSAFIAHMFTVKFGSVVSLPSKFRVDGNTSLLPSGDHCLASHV